MAETQAKCPNCEKITTFRKKKTRLKEGVERTYLKCWHCGYTRTVFYTDPESRKALAECQELLASNSATEAVKAKQAEIENMLYALLERMEPA